MKITISSTVPHRIVDYEMEDAEAISYYLIQLGYKKVTNG